MILNTITTNNSDFGTDHWTIIGCKIVSKKIETKKRVGDHGMEWFRDSLVDLP